jgi:enoyl-CoA hydratase
MRADRRSVYLQHGLPVRKALESKWRNSHAIVDGEGIAGAARFADGKGRHGNYEEI